MCISLLSNTPDSFWSLCALRCHISCSSLDSDAWLSWPLGPTAYLFFSSRLSVMINRKKNMVVSFGDGVTFVVVLHQVWKKEPAHHDFLGFYVVDSHGMSAQTHGLLGMKCSSFRLFRPHGGGKKPRERAS